MGKLRYIELEEVLQALIKLRSDLNNKIQEYPEADKYKVKRSLLYSSVRLLIEKLLHDIDTKLPKDIFFSEYKSDFNTLFRMYDESGRDESLELSFQSLRKAYKNLKKLML